MMTEKHVSILIKTEHREHLPANLTEPHPEVSVYTLRLLRIVLSGICPLVESHFVFLSLQRKSFL